MQHHPCNRTDNQQQHEGHRYAKQVSVGQVAKEVETFNSAEPFCFIFGDEASEAAIKQQPAKRDDERLHVQACDQQPVAKRQ